MKYYTEDYKYVAEFETGEKVVRGEPLDSDYPVFCEHIYFVDNILVRSNIKGHTSDLILNLISSGQKGVTKDSKVYRALRYY